jgi:hypothetical protein
MTKDAYFEMCEMLAQEPIDEEIPVELDDFPDGAQTCFLVYQFLKDNWDTMGGGYLGKDYSNVFVLLDLYGIPKVDFLVCLEILQHMDSVRSSLVANKLKNKSPSTK